MYKIEHNNLEAHVNPIGAELSSLKLNGKEYLWQGDERFWSGQAPILFPIVGALKDDCMHYAGNRYSMPRHGIARRSNFALYNGNEKGNKNQADDNSTITLLLKADNNSLQQYPWNFELYVQLTLTDSGHNLPGLDTPRLDTPRLDIKYEIVNKDNQNMLFTIGSHPAFALAIDNPSDLENYAIRIEQSEALHRYMLDDDGLLARAAEPFTVADNLIALHQNIFDEDALVFRDITARTVSLERNGQNVLSVDTGGAPHLGIWSKPGAPFVCIEPWLGTSDFKDSDGKFENKDDLQSLAPNQSFSHGISVMLPG